MTVERVVLVGFMAAGKSTVGRKLARRLGWPFCDSDSECERRAGTTVAEIFRTDGEAHFRELEQRVMGDLLQGGPRVIATGGGWAGRPGWTDGVPPGTFTVWLDVGVEQVLARTRTTRRKRPLLSGADPEGTVRRLLEERRPHYARADACYDTSRMDAAVTAEELYRRLSPVASGSIFKNKRKETR